MAEQLNFGKKITTETFYDQKLAGYQEEIVESVKVTRADVLAKIIDKLNMKVDKVEITVFKDSDFEPVRVEARWTKVVDKLGRKQ